MTTFENLEMIEHLESALGDVATMYQHADGTITVVFPAFDDDGEIWTRHFKDYETAAAKCYKAGWR